MDIRKLAPLAFLVALAACSGNSLNNGGDGDGGGGGEETGGVPEEVAVNLRAISYSAANGGTLAVNMEGLTSSTQSVAFLRRPDLDVEGYQAFIHQETSVQRSHLALVSTNARGNLMTTVVTDGGQFNRHFGGGHFARLDTFSRPTIGSGPTPSPATGQFSYAGTYAGVFVAGATTNGGLPPGLTPYEPLRIQGNILMTANFANDLVEGGVADRVILDDMGNVVLALEDISFPSTSIDGNGQFLGDVEFTGEPGTSIGSVGGIFGGIGATDIAGVTVINPIEGEDGLWEYGSFNLPACHTAGASPICLAN